MNKRTKPDTLFSDSLEAFYRYLRAQNISENTIYGYGQTFKLFLRHIEDKYIRAYDPEDIEEFLELMRTTPYSTRGSKPAKRKTKTILNYYIAFSSYWTWATKRGYADYHIIQDVSKPKSHQEPIEPLSPDDMRKILNSQLRSKPYKNRPQSNNFRPTGARDTALLYLMYDTALRLGEAYKLRIQDVEMDKLGGTIRIIEGKGEKSRYVPFSNKTADVLTEYLITRPNKRPDDWLFLNRKGKQMQIAGAKVIFQNFGKRAGVQRPLHPHLIRTTSLCHMAPKMNAFQLQKIAGHSDIKTTLRYIEAANLNLREAMQRASPVDNM